MPGVSLDPYQNIIGVGWGGQFLLLTLVSDGMVVFTDTGAGNFVKLDLVHPPGFPDAFVGFNGVDLLNIFPADADPAGKDWIFRFLDGYSGFTDEHFPTGQPPPDDTAIVGGAVVSWIVNLSAFIKAFGPTLILEGPPNVPDSLELGIHYGGSSAFDKPGSFGKIRWMLYGGAAARNLDTYSDRLTQAMVNLGVAQTGADAGNNAANMLTASVLRDADNNPLPFKEFDTVDAVAPNGTYGRKYRLVWDYFQRQNKLAYPPDGAKPFFDPL